MSFAEQRILSLLISNLSMFLVCCLCFWCHKRKYFLIQGHKDLHLCFTLLIFKMHTSLCHQFLYSFFWKSNSLYSFSMSPNWFFYFNLLMPYSELICLLSSNFFQSKVESINILIFHLFIFPGFQIGLFFSHIHWSGFILPT